MPPTRIGFLELISRYPSLARLTTKSRCFFCSGNSILIGLPHRPGWLKLCYSNLIRLLCSVCERAATKTTVEHFCITKNGNFNSCQQTDNKYFKMRETEKAKNYAALFQFAQRMQKLFWKDEGDFCNKAGKGLK